VCEDGLFILKYIVYHAHGEKMERVKVFFLGFISSGM
jgi:hypothetical protein